MNMKSKGNALLKGMKAQPVLPFFLCCVLVIVLIKPNFLTIGNIRSILVDASIYGVSALAMTIAIICGEFDLSLASNFAWGQILFCYLLNAWGQSGFGVLCALLVMVATCTMIGVINGLIVVFGKISAFITTLGMMTIVQGIALVFTDGKMIATTNESVADFSKFSIFGFSGITYVFLLVAALMFFTMGHTKFGRNIYATGGNYLAAQLSGIKVRFHKFIVFVILGFCAGISAALFVSLMRAGSVLYGTDLALTSVAATVIGGTALSGGKGSVLRTVFGVILIFVLYRALAFLGLQGYYNTLFKGLMLLVIVIVDAYILLVGKKRR